MDKKTMMILGVIGVGAIAYYLYQKNKDKQDAMTSNKSTPSTTTANFSNLVIDMSEGADEDGDNAFEIIDQYSGGRTNIKIK